MWDEKKSPSAKVELGNSAVRLGIEDSRRETREIFEGLSAGERTALAAEAWTLGLRAVSEERTEPDEPLQKPVRLSTIPPGCW